MAQLVQAPTRQPRLGGIKDIVGDFVEESRLGIAPIAWEDSGCNFPSFTRAGCYDIDVDPADKEFDGIAQHGAIAAAFALYAGVECWLGGDADRSYVEQAKDLLEQGEDRPVESRLWAWAADGEPYSSDSISEIVADLERQADGSYVGRPVLLMDRKYAALAFQQGALVREGGKLITGQGTPVLASGWFEQHSFDDAPYVASIIGQPAVYASPVRFAGVQEYTANLGAAIAERVYAIGVDCNFRRSATLTPTP